MVILTAAFTAAVKFVDVQPIGPEGTSVGLASINAKFANFVGVNYTFYHIAEILGLVIIGIFLIFGFMGLVQLIKRRNLLKVDRNILVLGGMYFLVFALYVVFQKVVIDYRPVIMPGETMPEASFPSSHTMLAIVVLVGAMMQLKYYVKRKSARVILMADLIIIMVLTVAMRMFSGVHWLTDIVAGVLFSLTLIALYCAVLGGIENAAKH